VHNCRELTEVLHRPGLTRLMWYETVVTLIRDERVSKSRLCTA